MGALGLLFEERVAIWVGVYVFRIRLGRAGVSAAEALGNKLLCD